ELSDVLEGVFLPYQKDARQSVVLRGPTVKLDARIALALAMVLHELAANAKAYGALGCAEGTLNLTWAVENTSTGRTLTIDWRESGGPEVHAPERRGFGSRLVERSISQGLKGSAEVFYDSAGVRCLLRIPLSNTVCDE